MKFLHDLLEKQKPNFEKGGKLEKFYYLFEAGETFMFTPPTVNGKKGVQVRDAIDLKRMMITVVIAMVPCLLFGIWNTGHQSYVAMGQDATLLQEIIKGLIVVIPVVLVSYTAGGLVEVVFAIMRKHPINEGYLVTGMLIPLVLPPTIPLWQVALAAIFATVIAKEVFGGTGMNILNVAMTARAFLYFAYPVDMAGDTKVWTQLDNRDEIQIVSAKAFPDEKNAVLSRLQYSVIQVEKATGPEVSQHSIDGKMVDGYTGATALGIASAISSDLKKQIAEISKAGQDPSLPADFKSSAITNVLDKSGLTFSRLAIGNIPGCIGETSFIMVLIGAVILIVTGVASARIILGVFVGTYAMGLLFNALAASIPGANAFMALPAHYHLVIGGVAFGAVFMATDPVTATQTLQGKWLYGILIGVLTVIIRVTNPAYPEGIMLAVLLMNVFAPLIDYIVIQSNKKRRLKRATV